MEHECDDLERKEGGGGRESKQQRPRTKIDEHRHREVGADKEEQEPAANAVHQTGRTSQRRRSGNLLGLLRAARGVSWSA